MLFRSDENGYYHKDGLMPGLHFCYAYIPGRRADVTGEASSIYDFVEVVEGETSRLDIHFCAGSGSVKGIVTSEVPIPPGTEGVTVQLCSKDVGDGSTIAKREYLTSTSVGSSYSFDDVCPGKYTIWTSLFIKTPGGARSQGFPGRLDPPGSFTVEAGGITQRDVILTDRPDE